MLFRSGQDCGDDFVDDTPVSKSIFGNLDSTTCKDLCPGLNPLGTIDNYQNIMYEGAQGPFMFTKGQVMRLRSTLESPISQRNLIWDTNVTSCYPLGISSEKTAFFAFYDKQNEDLIIESRAKNEIELVEVIDISDRIVKKIGSDEFYSALTKISLSELTNGVYLIQIHSNNTAQRSNFKIIK